MDGAGFSSESAFFKRLQLTNSSNARSKKKKKKKLSSVSSFFFFFFFTHEALLKRTAGSTPKDTNTLLMKKAKDFYRDLYLPANYVHEKLNQNEIQIFTKINSCFVSFLRQRCQNRVLSITDNSSDVCVCWWISWEALLLAQAVKRSHLYFNGLRSSGRMWLRATVSQWKRGSYVAGNLFVRVFYPYKWN